MRVRSFGFFVAFALVAAPVVADADSAADNTSSAPACAATSYAMGVRYQAASAEIDALRYQAYNTATRQLDDLLATRAQGQGKPAAVVLDLDETVLDNSPMEATAVVRCIDYTNWGGLWQQWVAAASAPLIPGAKAFLEHADKAGVSIYYVSNRATKNLDLTVKNLQLHDLPQARAAHVRLMGPPKTRRRATIEKTHDIVMLVGDSLHDFDGAFGHTPLDQQHAAVDRMRDAFGRRFIILPNATYGSWTKAELSAAPALAR